MNRLVPVLLACAVLASACGSPDYWAFQSRTLGPPYGTTFVAIWISDSPVDGLAGVHVGIDRVELLADDEVEVLSDQRSVHDLLTLQHGIRARIAEAEIPLRSYDRLRIFLAPESAGVNRVRTPTGYAPLVFGPFDDGTIELPVAVTFVEDGQHELQVDFNARMSVLEAGGLWTLQPATRLVSPATAGAVRGRAVAGGAPLPGVTISAQQQGLEILSARTGQDGTFLLTPAPSGIYDLVLTGAGHAPRIVPGVTVAAQQEHVLGDVPLDEAAPGTMSGQTVPGTGGLIRFRQAGLLIGVAGVDSQTGLFYAPPLPPGIYDVELVNAAGTVVGTDPGVQLAPLGTAFVDFTP